MAQVAGVVAPGLPYHVIQRLICAAGMTCQRPFRKMGDVGAGVCRDQDLILDHNAVVTYVGAHGELADRDAYCTAVRVVIYVRMHPIACRSLVRGLLPAPHSYLQKAP